MTDRAQSPRIHSLKLRVEFEDCDALGVVYHPNYFRFIERSRLDFLRTHHIPFADMMSVGVGLVVAEIQAYYWRPVRLEEEIWVYTRQVEFSEKKIILEQFICRSALEPESMIRPMHKIIGKVFGARMTLASVDLKTLRTTAVPAKMAEILSGLTVII
ncbi:MAG: thioesterase family protein [Proteobacteria bacterium]|nr:thioesterase family protein [Pseudomonadota bacterium]